MAGEHRLDAEVAGEIVPQRLAAADQHPGGQVAGGDAAVSGQSGEIGERAVLIEMIVLAAVIEVGVAGANGGEARLRAPDTMSKP